MATDEPNQPLERELKLQVSPDFSLPNLDGVAGLRATDRGERLLVARYWDTADLRLAAAHYGVRHRTDGAWTLKGPSITRADSQLMVRSEREFPGSPDVPPAELVQLLEAELGPLQLVPSVEVHTRRRTVQLHRASEPVAEVTHDCVTVMLNGQPRGDFAEVEVELSGADESALPAVVEALRAAGAQPSRSPSKYRRALQMAGLEAPVDVDPGHGEAKEQVQGL